MCLNGDFFQRRYTSSQYAYGKMFNTFVIRKTQIQSIATKSKATQDSYNQKDRCGGCGETGTQLPCFWECRIEQTLRKVIWQFIQK